jgi:pimeloyl-ACP methyl ester carboxylesterase
MAVFLRKLEEAQLAHHCENVTLVGHSMGAMIFNHGLRDFPDVHYNNIVYMAAACSIRDFNDTVIPYMERNSHQNTQFYGLSLHPRAEDRDRSVWEWVPRGSLLIWIDEFLGHPESFTDRTLGHFENALLASRLFPPRLQKRIHLTALSTGPGANELDEHGQFSSMAFWKPELYTEPGGVNRKNDPRLNLSGDCYKRQRADNAKRHLP